MESKHERGKNVVKASLLKNQMHIHRKLFDIFPHLYNYLCMVFGKGETTCVVFFKLHKNKENLHFYVTFHLRSPNAVQILIKHMEMRRDTPEKGVARI